ncbi:MAG: D-alanyl-D-alanine carboxypeptidase/D-alanyl-D-alanine-endopeptidase [Planctomycetaceae bacterium]|jgi:D-alanyl-D-alanine carboxypeptidase/D-alanyl-D-alanine-endopeptidase (penicillin-binding protein 4)|nr:D-alanyl-D-alanine carboxypeptidase/D-alanyl-D-alanine-endopeptidase [Planctomycetaceae bacterium]
MEMDGMEATDRGGEFGAWKGGRGIAGGWLRAKAAAVVMVVGMGGWWTDAAAAAQPSLSSEVRETLTRAKLGEAKAAICVVDVASGTVLAGVADRDPVIPASNLKLLTSGAALLALGPDFSFRTTLVREGSRLFIVGDGDPGLADPVLLAAANSGVDEFLDKLAAEAVRQGAGDVTEVVVDDRVFDRAHIHPSWPQNQLDAWYCAPVSGVNFFTNVVELYVSPGSARDVPPQVRLLPTARWLEVDNKARTVSGDNSSLAASRAAGRNVFQLTGTVSTRWRQDEPLEVSVQEPGLIFGRLMAERITRLRAGGAAAGAPVGVRMATADDVRPASEPLVVIRTPLATALSRCNVNSQNMYAESLLKRVGHEVTGQPGSWQNGGAVVRMQVAERLGSDASDLVISDGSGLSRENRVTTRILARWLGLVAQDPKVGDAFVASMATTEQGRLESRFRGRRLDHEVRAKTGFIRGVQALSGFVTHTGTGRRIAFSVIVNNTERAPAGSNVKDLHEMVVQDIDGWLTAVEGRAKPAAAPEPVR